jgi:AcrR family transcriptional regulator
MKVRTEARREAILEVASQVFLEFGYDRASVSEIVKRVGGSKSTIYGYFASKEELFLAVTEAAGEQHMASALNEIAEYRGGDLAAVLTRFAEKLISFLTSDEAVAAHRMVMGAAAQSDIGRLFYEAGPKRGLTVVAEMFRHAIELGELRAEDPWILSLHFGGLVSSEHQYHRLFDPKLPPLSRVQIKRSAGRSVSAFLRAYGKEHAGANGLVAE